MRIEDDSIEMVTDILASIICQYIMAQHLAESNAEAEEKVA